MLVWKRKERKYRKIHYTIFLMFLLNLCPFTCTHGRACVFKTKQKSKPPKKLHFPSTGAEKEKGGGACPGSCRLESEWVSEQSVRDRNWAVRRDAAVFNWTLLLLLLLFVAYHGLTEWRKLSGLCLFLTELCFVFRSDTFSIRRR